jgi:hypothetical protein
VIAIRARLAKALQEVGHLQKARDLAGVVAEDKSAHGDEHAHDERAPGQERDGRVDEITALFDIGSIGIVGIGPAAELEFFDHVAQSSSYNRPGKGKGMYMMNHHQMAQKDFLKYGRIRSYQNLWEEGESPGIL